MSEAGIEVGVMVGVIMGSQSDWATMRHAAALLDELGVGHEARIVSAHRTPERLYAYARTAKERGLKVIIAGAGGAAHLPGMTAAMTTLPVFGVPVETAALRGQDSLLSIVQMPAGVPVGTLAIGKPGRSTPRCWPRRSWRCPIRHWPSGWRPGGRGAPPKWPRCRRMSRGLSRARDPAAMPDLPLPRAEGAGGRGSG